MEDNVEKCVSRDNANIKLLVHVLTCGYAFDKQLAYETADKINTSTNQTLKIIERLCDHVAKFEIQEGDEIGDFYKIDRRFTQMNDLIAELSCEIHKYTADYFNARNDFLREYAKSRETMTKILQTKLLDRTAENDSGK